MARPKWIRTDNIVQFPDASAARSAIDRLNAHDALVEALTYIHDNESLCPCCASHNGHDRTCIMVKALRLAGALE